MGPCIEIKTKVLVVCEVCKSTIVTKSNKKTFGNAHTIIEVYPCESCRSRELKEAYSKGRKEERRNYFAENVEA